VPSKAKEKATVIIPALNEEEGIGLTLWEIKQLPDVKEIIVIDGGSVDGTAEIAEKTGARVLIERNTGKGGAIYEGIKHLNSDVQYVILTDADFTYPAQFIPKMVDILEANNDVGMVIGNRFGESNLEKSPIHPFYIISTMIQLISGIKLRDPFSGLRVVRTELLREWEPKSKNFGIEVDLNFQVERKGYRIVEIPISYRRRLGQREINLRNGLNFKRRLNLLGKIIRLRLKR
jgi:dolichol-phosphate mannosyltransferase